MARAQEMNSANSQFYIMFVPRLQMDRNIRVFGRVVSGMNFVDAIERGEPPLAPSRIVRASIGTDNVPPMSAAEIQAEAAGLPPRRRPLRPQPGRIRTVRSARPCRRRRPRRARSSRSAPPAPRHRGRGRTEGR